VSDPDRPIAERGPHPLTVLHLATNRWWTGSADPVLQLVAGLRGRGQRALLAVTPGDRFEAKAREAAVEPLPGFRLEARMAPREIGRDLRRLRQVIERERVDVVHAHHSHDHWLAIAVTRLRPGRRIPTVRTFHNHRAVKRDWFSRWLYRQTAAVFAVSRQIEGRCRDAGIPPASIAWVPGVVDLSRFPADADPAPIREELKLGRAPVIACVSRLAANRGHELLLRGFRQLLGTLPDARLLIVGKGEMRPRLEDLVAGLELTDRVVFTGYRDRDLPLVLAAADCFALMGAGADESCRAALEAMAAGRPVVARKVGALPETVVHGETGVLVAEDTPEAVATALGFVLGDRDRAERMGAAGRVRAETEFDARRAVTIVEDVYRRLV
jgi:glycosyltransferase involved in cell wall biosynthesis